MSSPAEILRCPHCLLLPEVAGIAEAAVVAVAAEGRSTANVCRGRVVAAVDVAAVVAEVEEGSVLVTRSEREEEDSTVAEVAEVAAEAVVDSVAAADHGLPGVLQAPVNFDVRAHQVRVPTRIVLPSWRGSS